MNTTKTRIYSIWLNMKRRCDDTKHKHYSRYGGRGISYCDEWKDAKTFMEWGMRNGYSDTLTLDRIDNDGNYEPSNCRWVSQKDQANNTSQNVYITYNEESLTIMQWSEKLDLPYSLIYSRYNKGLSPEKIFETPSRIRKITYKRKTQTLTEWANENGLTPETLSYRLSKNIPFGKAIGKKISKTITIDGVTHTYAEWTEIMGLTPNLIRSRIACGMSEREAVLTPKK